MRRLIQQLGACALAASLCLAAASARAATVPPELPWELAAAGDGGTVEGMFVVADLRQLDQQMQSLADLIRQSPAGAALLGGPAADANGAAAPSSLQSLLDMAAPTGQPVPAAALLVASDGGLDARLALRVHANFLQRCAAAQQPAYQVKRHAAPPDAPPDGPTQLAFVPRDGGTAYAGQLWQDGTLVLTGTAALLPRTLAWRTTNLPGAALRAQLAGSQSALWLRGGALWRRGLQALGDGPLAAGLRDIDGLALALRTDGANSSALRLLVEAPWVAALRGALQPQPTTMDSLLPSVDAAAFGYASLQSTELLRNAGRAYLTAAQRQLQLPELRSYGRALDRLTGRVGLLSYEAPGDWAMAWQLEDAAAAQAAVGDLQKLAGLLLPRLSAAAVAAEEPLNDASPAHRVLHLRPDPAVDGILVTALQDTVWWVANRGRLQALASQAATPWRAARSVAAPLLQGPMTPLLREVLQAPSLLQGYLVLRGDGAWLDQAQFLAAGTLAPPTGKLADAAAADASLSQTLSQATPKLVALLGDLYLRTYDLAWSAGITGDLLDVTWAISEL